MVIVMEGRGEGKELEAVAVTHRLHASNLFCPKYITRLQYLHEIPQLFSMTLPYLAGFITAQR